MTVRNLLNAYLGEYKFIRILDYIGDDSSIGADLDEDYERIGVYPGMNAIPECVMLRKVEYFSTDPGDYSQEITIFLASR